jgi:hypothetical protein
MLANFWIVLKSTKPLCQCVNNNMSLNVFYEMLTFIFHSKVCYILNIDIISMIKFDLSYRNVVMKYFSCSKMIIKYFTIYFWI